MTTTGLRVLLDVSAEDLAATYRPYFELHGTDAHGRSVPGFAPDLSYY